MHSVFRRLKLDTQVIRYGIVGVIGTMLHIAVLVLLVEKYRLSPLWASSLGFLVVLIVSFILNRYWTFRSYGTVSVEFAKYCVTCVFGFILNFSIMFFFVDVLSWNYVIGQTMVILVIPISNFLLSRYWCFRVRSRE